MNELRTSIDSYGKILIPAKLRKELKFVKGETLVIRRINNELRLISLKNVIKQIQDNFKLRSKSEISAVDEFIEQKNIDREIENKRTKSLSNTND